MSYKGYWGLVLCILFILAGCESETQITERKEATKRQAAVERAAILEHEEEVRVKKAERLRKEEIRNNRRIDHPFDLGLKSLPIDFEGHDIIVVIDQLNGIQKNLYPPTKKEFETSSEYRSRKKSHNPLASLLGDTDIDQHHLAFIVNDDHGEQVYYDADHLLLRVNLDFRHWVISEKLEKEFSKYEHRYILDAGTEKKFSRKIKMPIDEAKNIKPYLKALVITTLKSPWYRESFFSRADGIDIPTYLQFAHSDVKQIWLFNSSTGDIIKKWTILK